MNRDSGGAPGPETPKAAVARLSLYLRQLDLMDADRMPMVSSRDLGQALGLTDAQVRKDLGYFGQFGRPGVGYSIVALREELRRLLGVDRRWTAALIGVGHLGRALLGYRGFQQRGFEIAALFDIDASLVGTQVGGIRIEHVDRITDSIREKEIRLALVAVPAEAAQKVASLAAAAGVAGILNFAPVPIRVPETVSVVSVDLGLQLEQLVYQVSQRTAANGG